jgi:septum formation protein
MLLQRLLQNFECESPDLDESPLSNEAPAALVTRLAREKAGKVAAASPHAIVIGSDQTALFDNTVVSKPVTHKRAVQQLESFSGRSVEFLTAVSVINQSSGFAEHYTDHTVVKFRKLQAQEIERYLLKEQPYDCAGAFKAESLGVVLFERIDSHDPTALIGLPLIETASMLRHAGLQLP